MSFQDKISLVQKHLRSKKCGGWLLYDFRHSNRLACQFLGIPPTAHLSRRFYYWIPSWGDPVKLVHNIEANALDHLPGAKISYSTWQQMQNALQAIVGNAHSVLMEYSPNNAIPTISLVDGGCLDLVRNLVPTIESSGDLLQQFTAVLDKSQRETHLSAAKNLDEIAAQAWEHLSHALEKGKTITEYDLQQYILKKIEECRCIALGPPICAVNGNAANPHYTPEKERCQPIIRGDLILIDLWCKLDKPNAVYGDICRIAVAAEKPTEKQQKIFDIVKQARNASLALIYERFAANKPLHGWEVDKAARNLINQAGYGHAFIHRTGHNIGTEVHGDGAHMDSYETYDYRRLLPETCFSIEPGIYLPGKFGIKLECNVLIHSDGAIEVTGGKQEEIKCLL